MAKNQSKKLTFYMSSSDKFGHEPLSEMVVYAAKRFGLTGATAIKGFMGFGSSSVVSNLRFWEFSEKVPVVVEIIDEESKINNFIAFILPYFDKVKKGCMITLQDVEIILQKTGAKRE